MSKVLIIEDNRDAAETLRLYFEILGHKALVAFDGKSGFDSFVENKPEIVLCDIGLPKMDGFEVAEAIRSVEAVPEAFLVAITGYGRAEDQARSKEAGFDVHLVKPVDLEDLTNRIARLL